MEILKINRINNLIVVNYKSCGQIKTITFNNVIEFNEWKRNLKYENNIKLVLFSLVATSLITIMWLIALLFKSYL